MLQLDNLPVKGLNQPPEITRGWMITFVCRLLSHYYWQSIASLLAIGLSHEMVLQHKGENYNFLKTFFKGKPDISV